MFAEFLRTRSLTCPVKPEMDKMKEEIIQKIEAVNNVHREEKYKELEAKLESQEKAADSRKAFWWKFWSGIGAAVVISLILNYAMPKIMDAFEIKTEKEQEKDK